VETSESTATRTYYDLLGVARTATVDEIKEAYREIARIYHPDSNFYAEIVGTTQDRDSHYFKEATAAYNVLVNTDKRAHYDLTLPPELASWDDLREQPADSFAETVYRHAQIQRTFSQAFIAPEERDQPVDLLAQVRERARPMPMARQSQAILQPASKVPAAVICGGIAAGACVGGILLFLTGVIKF
jgi:DnaJ-class molecular chaperone